MKACGIRVLALLAVLALAGALPAATVRVAICQVPSVDYDLQGNLAKMKSYVQQASAAGAKICVFPELVDLGFGNIVNASTGHELAAPIPGTTTDAIGAMAIQYDMWIEAAIAESVPGGVYDTNVLIDNKGKVVLKQRKYNVYPVYGGAPCIHGNYQDAHTVPSPWGPIGVMNCADTNVTGLRGVFAAEQPSLMLVSYANPPANLLAAANALAQECACPVVGCNQVFPGNSSPGGLSLFVSAAGATLWQAGSVEVLKTWDLTVNPAGNLRPSVSAGDTQTIRLPVSSLTLQGSVSDDGLPSGALSTAWTKVSGPGTVTFSNAAAPTTPASFSTAGVYILRLTANDGALSRSGDVCVNVLPASGDLNLAGLWNFENSASDSSGLGNHGTAGGVFSYSTDVPPGIGSTRSLDLGGGKGYVQVPHNASLNATSAVTIACWIKPRVSFPGFYGNGGNDWCALVNKGDTWGAENYSLAFGAYFYIYGQGVGLGRNGALDASVLIPGNWYHVATVLDANSQCGKIYINGVLDHMWTLKAQPAVTNSNTLNIGCFKPANTTFDGKIDDVRLYTRALSDAEIAALVPGATVNQSPVVNAGADQTIAITSNAALSGTIADDGHPATSATASWTCWRKVGGPGDVSFGNAFTPATTASFSQPGTYELALTASDGSHRVSDTVKVTVTGASNTPPTITPISNQTTTTGAATPAIAFTIADAETSASALAVSGSSSNTALLPNAGLVFGGSGASRTLTLTPAAGQTGTATVTVTVSDGTATAVATFTLTVVAPGNIVSINTSTTYQTIEAWSIADHLARMGPSTDVLARQKIDEVVNDLGITANRCLVTPTNWEPLNDDGDPETLNSAMIQHASIDNTLIQRTQYFKQVVEANGYPCVLYASSWEPQDAWVVYSPGEYSERLISYLQYLKSTYGLTLKYYTIENEPLNANIYTAQVMGDIIKTVGPKLQASGLSTRVSYSEFLNTVTGWQCIQALQNDPDVWPYVGLLSYHLYDYNGTLDPSRSYIRDFGKSKGIPTAQTEGPTDGLTIGEMFDDLENGGVSIWSLYGWGKFLPSRPDGTSFTHYDPIYWQVRQMTHYVRPGSVRVGTASTNPSVRAMAFVKNGKVTTVLATVPWFGPTTVTVQNLPPGQYGVSSSGSTGPFSESGIQTVGASGTLTVTVPSGTGNGSALTIYPYAGTNQAPAITNWLSSSPYLTLPASTTTLQASANDAELDPITYAWSVKSQPAGAQAVLASPNAANTAASGLTIAGQYVFTLTVKDPTHTLTRDVYLNVYTSNQSPTVACVPRVITLPTSNQNLSVDARDLEGDAMTFQWSVVSQPAGASAALATPTASACMASNLTVAGSYVFHVVVKDSSHTVATDQTVTVYPANLAPVISSATATPAAITLPTASTSLTAVTSDPDASAMTPWRAGGDVLSHWWVVKSAPAGAKPVFSTPGARNTIVSGLSVAGTYVFTLRAIDRTIMTVRDVTVTVNPDPGTNQAPAVNAGADQSITLPAIAALAGTASDDGRPAPLSTTWSKVSGPGTVTFANSGALITTAAFSQAGTYQLRLTASDSALTTSDDVSITVSPAANQPPVIQSAPWANPNPVTLPNATTVNVAASDPDSGPNPLTYTWSQTGGPGTVVFSPNGTAGSSASAATFSTPGTYTLRVTVSDGAASVSASLTVQANAPATNPPVITSALSANATTGVPFNYTITATNNPTVFNASGLQAGLTLNAATGVISGTPTTPGIASVTISATNADGTGSATLVLTILSGGPIARWKLDEGSGLVAGDDTGNGYTGTLTNGPTWTTGAQGNALQFDGINDYVDCGASTTLNVTGDLTVTAWIWHNTQTGADVIVAKGGAYNAKSPFGIRIAGGGKVGVDQNDGSAGQDSLFSNAAVPLASWHHVAVTRDAAGRTRSIYIDGALNAGPAAYTHNGTANATAVSIGGLAGAPGDSQFDGKIDDVRIYNRALTAAEVLAIFTSTSPQASPSAASAPADVPVGGGLLISQLQGSVRIPGGHDSCVIKGTLPDIPASFDPTGQVLTVDIGSGPIAFNLDAKGRGKTLSGTVALKLKMARDKTSRKRQFAGGEVPFTIKLQNGAWAAAWGMDETSLGSASMTPNVTLDASLYSGSANVIWVPKAKSGWSFKKSAP